MTSETGENLHSSLTSETGENLHSSLISETGENLHSSLTSETGENLHSSLTSETGENLHPFVFISSFGVCQPEFFLRIKLLKRTSFKISSICCYDIKRKNNYKMIQHFHSAITVTVIVAQANFTKLSPKYVYAKHKI